MKKMSLLLLGVLSGIVAYAQTIDYFMPGDVTFNKEVPTPAKFAGHEVGEWHLSHDKLVFYMLELARVSDRAIWEEYAKSHEGRPLGQLIISSPENIRNIEQLRQQHLILCDPSQSDNADISKMPVFIKLGYGIHGNESSAQNASVLAAYYLVAGEGRKLDELLRDAVILIDPALNPDGMQRHSSWVNFTRSLNNNPDPASWEFFETWPGGRTNHYWFDLNRDYIMLQHPESAGRVNAFYRWRPNINTDHHEMGANYTFFFQPGIQSRNNPLTPAENQALTVEIGKYHEKYLNEIGSLYYTEESYDDFYVGKGSSYPDIHGSVGILFEQAGTKGHLKETPGHLLSFPFAIRNQFTVSLSSIEAGLRMKNKLLESQRNFYKEALPQADKYPIKAYIFSETSDLGRTREFINVLLQHRIKVYKLAKDITKNNTAYKSGESYIVPLRQNEYRFIRSLFEPVKEFTDSTFYDVSTWVLPMAFNITYSVINAAKEMTGLTGEEITGIPAISGKLVASEKAYAYLFEWNEYLAPKALYMLQNAGIITKVSTSKFRCDDGTLKRDFSYGTIMIPANGQPVGRNDLHIMMGKVAAECGLTIYGTSTGMTPQGIDLGSNGFTVLEKPSVLMITGDGINAADAGEIWHMFDTRFNIPVTMVTANRLGSIDLDRYNVMIIAGSPAVTESVVESMRSWNRTGGTIIGYKGGNNWLSSRKLAEIEFVPVAENKRKVGIYGNMPIDNQLQLIPGSIFEARLDLTHPLCYGYTKDLLPVMKSGATVALKNSNIYNNPVSFTASPHLSGYCTPENIERIKNNACVSVHGRRIISLYDNTNFRAIWYGTNKLFLNAVFFGQIL